MLTTVAGNSNDVHNNRKTRAETVATAETQKRCQEKELHQQEGQQQEQESTGKIRGLEQQQRRQYWWKHH